MGGSRPFLDPRESPEFAPLRENWRAIGEEGLHLLAGGSVLAASAYDDLGFNCSFRTG